MLVSRCDGTAPTAGGSSERRIHLAPQPDQQAERRELREDGRVALEGLDAGEHGKASQEESEVVETQGSVENGRDGGSRRSPHRGG
jgi:hypothetical protein